MVMGFRSICCTVLKYNNIVLGYQDLVDGWFSWYYTEFYFPFHFLQRAWLSQWMGSFYREFGSVKWAHGVWRTSLQFSRWRHPLIYSEEQEGGHPLGSCSLPCAWSYWPCSSLVYRNEKKPCCVTSVQCERDTGRFSTGRGMSQARCHQRLFRNRLKK